MAANGALRCQGRIMRRYHGRNLRRGRFSELGRAYLVTTVTHGRRPLFSDLFTGRKLVQALKHEAIRAETLCFVVMPDHLHWLLVLKKGDLSACVRNVKAGSSRIILGGDKDRAPIWQRGFHDHAVREDQDLRALARYVIANPLRARLVDRIGDYPLWNAVWL